MRIKSFLFKKSLFYFKKMVTLLFVLVSQFWVLSSNFLKECIELCLSNTLQKRMAIVLSHFSFVWLFVTLWGCSPAGSSVHGILQARMLEWISMSCSKRFANPGSTLRWQMGSLPLTPPGKPKNATGPWFFLLSVLFNWLLCLIVFIPESSSSPWPCQNPPRSSTVSPDLTLGISISKD